MRTLLGALLLLGAIVAVVWVPLWFAAPPGWTPVYGLLALTPVAVVGAALVGVLALVAHRWVPGGWLPGAAALVAALVLAALVAPRAVPDGGPAPGGVPVVVATANLQFGRADPAAVVALVREHRVDVLGLQELTPDAEARLVATGLADELPFRVSAARDGAGGTALYARAPLASSGIPLMQSGFAQVTARATTAAGPLDVVVTHPEAPIFRHDRPGWEQELAELPGPAPAGGPARVVMGDLNASLDHRPLRDVLGRGHRDVAAALGAGLTGTWPTDRPWLPPFTAIDHVLVSGAVVPARYTTVRVPGTDHAAVVAVLGRSGR